MTTQTISKMTHTSPKAREIVALGHRDAKGREIGCIVDRWTAEFEIVDVNDTLTYYRIKPGHYHVVWVQASRDGKSFGSSQPRNFFTTEAEMEAYVAKRIADSTKAAAKKGA